MGFTHSYIVYTSYYWFRFIQVVGIATIKMPTEKLNPWPLSSIRNWRRKRLATQCFVYYTFPLCLGKVERYLILIGPAYDVNMFNNS